jgi:hypothetical protein
LAPQAAVVTVDLEAVLQNEWIFAAIPVWILVDALCECVFVLNLKTRAL